MALGLTLTALSVIVLIPLIALVLKAASAGPTDIVAIATSPRTLAAFRLSFGAALTAAFVNAAFGLLIAWLLVRYQFPGRRLLDAAVDLPFALPTAVAGVALAAIYGPNGWIGGLLAPFDIKVAYTPLGVMVALIFVGLPFVVRSVQPVLEDVETEIEEAAALLGSSRLRTIFAVVLPPVLSGASHRSNIGVRARGRGIWVRDLHRGQCTDGVRNRPASHSHQARAVRLCRRRRGGDHDADSLVRPHICRQRAANLQPPEARRCLTPHWRRHSKRRPLACAPKGWRQG